MPVADLRFGEVLAADDCPGERSPYGTPVQDQFMIHACSEMMLPA
jgi:hypothetical protein